MPIQRNLQSLSVSNAPSERAGWRDFWRGIRAGFRLRQKYLRDPELLTRMDPNLLRNIGLFPHDIGAIRRSAENSLLDRADE